jgi:hypothetical protein
MTMTTSRSLAMLVCCAALAACSKEGAQSISAPAPGAAVKFYNFSTGAPGVNFYANDTKATAISSTNGTESTSGTAFGAVAAGGFYVGLAPGQYTLSGRLTPATADSGLAIASAPSTLADGKYYSFYLSGPYNTTTKQTDWFMVEDPIPAQIDYANAVVRFVNGVYNGTGPLTLWIKSTVTGDSGAVSGPVAYKAASPFVTVPGIVYDLTARYTGSNTAVISRAGVSFVAGRVYTISARTGAVLDNTANR